MTRRPQQSPADVLVVGAGPAGLVAALSLAQKGVPVTLLEATAGPSQRSRASTFHPSTLDLLDDLGVADALVTCGRPARRLQYRDRDEGVVAEFDYAAIAAHTRYPFRLQVEQRELTRLAYERLRTFPNAEIHFRTVVDGVRNEAGSAVVTAGDREFHARWVIGADGAHSAVRAGLGIAFDGVTYDMRYLTVMVDLDFRQLLPDIADVTYVWGGEEGVSFMGLRDHWRVVLRVAPDESDQDAMAEDRLQARLRAAVPMKLARYPVIDSFLFTVHRRVAETFHRGHVVLAGDAAHLNSPSGGMGMNSGIHDAYVFAQATAEILDDCCGVERLQAAAEERRRVAREVVGARSESNYRDVVENDIDSRRRRREEMQRIAGDPELTRQYLLRASMFDSAPRPVKRKRSDGKSTTNNQEQSMSAGAR